MKYYWVIKINGMKQATGHCQNKEDAISEAERYFMQYGEEEFNKITLEIKVK